MKRLTTKIVVGLGILCVTLFSHSSTLAITLSFDPSHSIISTGDSLDVDIVVSCLANHNIANFDLDIIYDETLLSFDGYELYSGLGDIATGDAEDWSFGDLGGGVIDIAEFSWLDDFDFQPDVFSLVTLSFSVADLGTSSLVISNAILGDEKGESLPEVTLKPAKLAPVPEPSTLMLIGLGLVALGAVQERRLAQDRKRKHRASKQYGDHYQSA